MDKIVKDLFLMQDEKYKDFTAKLIPNINKESIIGVRTPELRIYAKNIKNYDEFLSELPHAYHEENQLHSFIISNIKDYEKVIDLLNKFLPYVNNWATCDMLSPKVFAKNRNKLVENIKEWLKSKHIYTIRFGIEMLMSHFLDDDFKVEYLNLVKVIRSDEYYVNMMIAWYFATALAKHYKESVKVLENKELDTWTHNKTIQKAIESYRITEEQKEYLRSLKIK